MRAFHSRYDYGHLAANDWAVAVELAFEHKPDLILRDIHMGGMDGYEASRAMQHTTIV